MSSGSSTLPAIIKLNIVGLALISRLATLPRCSARYSLSTSRVETCDVEHNPLVTQPDPVGVSPRGPALDLLRTSSGDTECACFSDSNKVSFNSGCAAGYSCSSDVC
ncbi:hypothetical protein OPQ81_010001 [Rhizoctonia solani]|nr:hypothetical protein OPQ81_010001 [Rhizoctonia solani]